MRNLRNIFVWSMCLSVAAMAAADANSDFLKFCKDMAKKTDAAFAKRDTAFFDKMSTDDFTYTEMGQQQNKKDALKQMKAMFKTSKTIDSKTTVKSSKVTGNTGVCQCVGTFKAVMMMPNDKKYHKMTGTEYDTQTWVKVGKTWKLSKIVQTKTANMKLDGKPFDPSKMGAMEAHGAKKGK
jgi:hypothetical protein